MIISPDRFTALKTKVKAECQRRKYTGSVASYGGAAYDYSRQPTVNTVVTTGFYAKNAEPLNAILQTLDTDPNRIIDDEELAVMESAVLDLSSKSLNASSLAATGCKANCTGLCYTSCGNQCTDACTSCTSCSGGCSGCGSGCGSGCSGCSGCGGCGSGCDGWCTGDCFTSCTGTCGTSCSGTCQGCQGCSGCSTYCATSCLGVCADK